MNRIINEFFRQRANMRILKQDALFRIYLAIIRMTDEQPQNRRK